MVAKRGYVPDRGDLVWLNFNPTRGHEQSGNRPALVLSPRLYNAKSGLALVCPITSNQKGYPFEVAVDHKNIQGVVLTDQIRSVDWKERKAKKITKISSQILENVQEKLKLLII